MSKLQTMLLLFFLTVNYILKRLVFFTSENNFSSLLLKTIFAEIVLGWQFFFITAFQQLWCFIFIVPRVLVFLFGNISIITSSSDFSVPSFHPLGTLITYILGCLKLSQSTLVFCSFFEPHFCFILDSSYRYVFKFTSLSFCNVVSRYSHWVFFFPYIL